MRVSTYKVEDFWAPPAGAFLGGEISELPSPVINLEIQWTMVIIVDRLRVV